MRELFVKPPIAFMIKSFFTQPLFSLGLILSSVLFLITIALSFSGVSETWEKRCGRMLLFTLVPVYTWLANFFFPRFQPLMATTIIWFVFIFLLSFRRLKSRVRENKVISSSGSWRCTKCKTINEHVYLACKKCKHPQRKKRP